MRVSWREAVGGEGMEKLGGVGGMWIRMEVDGMV